jgi:hypothetical protein
MRKRTVHSKNGRVVVVVVVEVTLTVVVVGSSVVLLPSIVVLVVDPPPIVVVVPLPIVVVVVPPPIVVVVTPGTVVVVSDVDVVVELSHGQLSVTVCPTAFFRQISASVAVVGRVPFGAQIHSGEHCALPTATRRMERQSDAVGPTPFVTGWPQSP